MKYRYTHGTLYYSEFYNKWLFNSAYKLLRYRKYKNNIITIYRHVVYPVIQSTETDY